MKKHLLLSTIFIFLLQIFSFSQNLQWAKSMGGTGTDAGISIATDLLGNVYTTGFFNGTVDFDPGAGTFNLTSAGDNDIFISKLDASGNFLWAKAMGGTSQDNGYSIAVDATGNIYTTGFFNGTADFDPGAGTYNFTSANSYEIFVSKLDAFGNFMWAKQMGFTITGAIGSSISVDGAGNVYTTGWFNGTADFDPNTGTYNLTSAGIDDIFVSKLDASGNFLWAKRMGGAGSENANSHYLDGSGNIYTTGRFSGTADFDPDAGTFNLTSAGGSDIFISKLDSSGNFVWAKSMGGTNDDNAYDITTDASGNVFSTGVFNGTADFDPGSGVFNLISSVGTQDIFISKLDSSGIFVWAKSMGGAASDGGSSIATDASGNVYSTGYFTGIADFDPGTGVFNLTSAGAWDIFISKLDAMGNFIGAKSMGGTGTNAGNSIATDLLGNVYSTGYFSATVDFDPNADTFNLTSAGAEDIFVLKMSPTFSISGTIYKSDSITEITSGKVYLLKNIPAVQLAYTDSFSLNGTNGNYSFSNVNSGNYLIVAKPNKSVYPDAIPTYYGDTVFWQGAINLSLTADTAGINIKVKEVPPLSGSGLLRGRVQYGIGSGKTGIGMPSPLGDPVPGIDISLDEIPGGIKAHTTTDSNGEYAFANVPINATYKIIVDLAALLMDSTYTLLLDNDNSEFSGLDFVVDTSSGVTGVFVGWPLGTSDFQLPTSDFLIYPNPNEGTFTIEFLPASGFGLPTSIKIYNILGEIVYTSDFSLPSSNITLKQPSGIYNVQVMCKGFLRNKKIVIE